MLVNFIRIHICAKNLYVSEPLSILIATKWSCSKREDISVDSIVWDNWIDVSSFPVNRKKFIIFDNILFKITQKSNFTTKSNWMKREVALKLQIYALINELTKFYYLQNVRY